MIVGLGNPGAKYLCNRHNIGFMVIDRFKLGIGNPPEKREFHAVTSRFQIEGNTVVLAKPQGYMNHSGEAVRALLDYYKISQEELLVIHDDIDQPFGAMRFQKDRGAGGHNGIRSIHTHLGNQDYARLKLGVGRPSHSGMDVADYVLQDFSSQEESLLGDFLDKAGDALEYFVFHGFVKAANKFNGSAL